MDEFQGGRPGAPALRLRASSETCKTHEAGVLAPGDAHDWLRLQRALAWHPERVAPLLRAGTPPAALLGALRGTAAAAAAWDAVFERAVARLEACRARVVPLVAPAYPEPLAAIEDPPAVLLVRGSVACLRGDAVAVVGARAATRAARAVAFELARDLASRGLVIVSGLARGIDAAAHRGALEAGGVTVGVLACGPETIYPPEHRGLAESILERGAVVSEMPPGTPPRRSHFPLRNRLISGLSRAVVVVEARARSGSLITVRHALQQGREVFVVPGAIDVPAAAGTNQLLREGARPVRNARDVLEDLGIEPVDPPPDDAAESAAEAPDGASTETAQLLGLLESGPLARERLGERLGWPPGRLARLLLELELGGLVEEDRDGRLRRCRTGAG